MKDQFYIHNPLIALPLMDSLLSFVYLWLKLRSLRFRQRTTTIRCKNVCLKITHSNFACITISNSWGKKSKYTSLVIHEGNTKQISTISVTLYLIKLIDVRKNTNEHRILYKRTWYFIWNFILIRNWMRKRKQPITDRFLCCSKHSQLCPRIFKLDKTLLFVF